MAASDHLHPGQLKLLMTARELYNTHSIDVPLHPEARLGGHWKTMDAMWKTKRKENKASRGTPSDLPASIAEHGVHMPVTLATGGPDLGDRTVIEHGHHRIVEVYDQNPEMLLPVEHEDYSRRKWSSVAEQDEHARRLASIPGWTEHNYFPSYP